MASTGLHTLSLLNPRRWLSQLRWMIRCSAAASWRWCPNVQIFQVRCLLTSLTFLSVLNAIQYSYSLYQSIEMHSTILQAWIADEGEAAEGAAAATRHRTTTATRHTHTRRRRLTSARRCSAEGAPGSRTIHYILFVQCTVQVHFSHCPLINVHVREILILESSCSTVHMFTCTVYSYA